MLRVSTAPTTLYPDEELLARIRLDGAAVADPAKREWSPGIPLLRGSQGDEFWFTRGPVRDFRSGSLQVSQGPEMAWVGAEFPAGDDQDVAALAEEVFSQLLSVAEQHGLGSLLRTWIAIPDILRGDGDRQRYKQFCIGRARVFGRQGIASAVFPAATVVGTSGQQLHLHALFTQTATNRIANPRQLNAFEYPRQYGPQSPSFCRAAAIPGNGKLISGTAAIRGADSQFPGQLARQCADIHRNLASLITQTPDAETFDAPLAYGRIYLRPDCTLGELDAALARHLPYAAQWPVFAAEICREELLCEVETACL